MAAEENKDLLALDEEDVDPLNKKGFEHGYWLKKGNTIELDGIIKRNSHAKYGADLKNGKAEAMREMTSALT